MKFYRAIYDTKKIKNCKYDFRAEDAEDAIDFANRWFTGPVSAVAETDEGGEKEEIIWVRKEEEE